MKNIKIAPSILSADFSRIGEEIKNITEQGADVIHLDVMDGVFVKNITFGPKFIQCARPYSKAVFDAHLMIVKPWNYIRQFAEAGSDITVHYEACEDRLQQTLKEIKALGVKCGAVINPDTDVKKIESVIEECDMILLMSVFPGFGGQKFIPEVLPKLEQVAKLIGATPEEVIFTSGATESTNMIIKGVSDYKKYYENKGNHIITTTVIKYEQKKRICY